MAKILILIGAHLCMAPRPQKEAEALAGAGHDVTVRGFWHDSALAARDEAIAAGKRWRFKPVVDFRGGSFAGRVRNLDTRLRWRIAREKYQRFRTVSPSLLGYGAAAMYRAALRARADLTIVHSEVGLWVGSRLLDKGYRVGVDFEDWFSEDLLADARAARPVGLLKELEGRLLRGASYRLATSHAMAEALSEAYHAARPAVVYNVFPFAERAVMDGKSLDKKSSELPSLHWFSQTIGPGRGLENLLLAAPNIKTPVEIHLRGRCGEDGQRWLESRIPESCRGRVFVHETVPGNQLLSRIAEHDVGLALEVTDIPSRNLTVTNKLFQYMQAGLALIATETAGQSEVLSQAPGVGALIHAADPPAFAVAVDRLVSSPERLRSAQAAAINAAREKFCWERQVPVLLEEAERSLAGSRHSFVA